MIQGLKGMGDQGLLEIGRMIHIQGRFTPEQIVEQCMKWMSNAVGGRDHTPEGVERSALEWVARQWHLPTDNVSTDDLERSIRVQVAAGASEYLAPVWKVTCALIAVGPKDAIPGKLELLEKAATLVVPSASQRQQLMQGWKQMAEQPVTADELKPTLELLKGRSDVIDQTLSLALVVTLADGRLALEEEQLIKAIGEELGKSVLEVQEVIRKVNAQFWGHQIEVTPKGAVQDARLEKETALRAAELTLGKSGALEGLAFEAGAELHGDEAKGPTPQAGWKRMLGGLCGLNSYFTSKLRGPDQVTLVRIIYLSIIRQHAQAVAEIAAHKPVETHVEAEQAKPRSYHEVGPSKRRESIKLDET